MRISWALLTFTAIIAAADALGWGHGYINLLLLTASSLVAAWFLTSRGWGITFDAFLAFSLFVAALSLVQIAYGFPRARGPFGSANYMGAFAALMVFLAVRRRGRFGITAIIANVGSLAMAQSRGAILAAGAGALVLTARTRPRLAAATGAGAIFAALLLDLARSSVADHSRLAAWKIGARVAGQRLLLGWGQGGVTITTVQDGLIVAGIHQFYSVPLDWLIAGGMFGLAAGVWVIVEALRAARDESTVTALLVAWIVSGMFIYDTAATAIPLFAVFGYLASKYRNPAGSAGIVDDRKPFLNGGMRAGRPHR